MDKLYASDLKFPIASGEASSGGFSWRTASAQQWLQNKGRHPPQRALPADRCRDKRG